MPDLKPRAGTCTGLGESSAPAPHVEIYSAETDAVQILTIQCPIATKLHHIRDKFSAAERAKCGECENKVYPSYSCWSEKSRDSHPSGRVGSAPREPCAWVITGGWADKEGAREINTCTEENKNR